MKNQATQQAVVHFRESEFNGSVSAARSFSEAAQKMLDQHIENGNYFPLDDVNYFHQIELEGENFYKKKIVEITQPIKLDNGMTVKQDAMANLIDWPDLSWTWFARNEGLRASLFNGRHLCSILENKVFVDQEKVEALRDSLIYKAKTKVDEQIFEAHTAAANAINDLYVILNKTDSGIYAEMKLYELFRFGEKIERRSDRTMEFCISANKND